MSKAIDHMKEMGGSTVGRQENMSRGIRAGLRKRGALPSVFPTERVRVLSPSRKRRRMVSAEKHISFLGFLSQRRREKPSNNVEATTMKNKDRKISKKALIRLLLLLEALKEEKEKKKRHALLQIRQQAELKRQEAIRSITTKPKQRQKALQKIALAEQKNILEEKIRLEGRSIGKMLALLALAMRASIL